MLMSAGIEPPRKVWIHGFLVAPGGDRMSKSRGNMFDPTDVVNAFGADGARYVSLREVPFDKDAEVSWDSFVRRYNADLANDFGNLVNRTVSMARRYLGGPRPTARPADEASLAASWSRAVATYEGKLDSLLLHDALAALWEFVGEANRFVEAEQPWALAKTAKGDGEEATAAQARLEAALGDLVEAVRLVALAAAPFMPTIAPRALGQLGYDFGYAADGIGGPPLLDELAWGRHGSEAGQLGTPEPLFPRLETESAAAAVDSGAG
jgi:methionyl-tRNA synthetase